MPADKEIDIHERVTDLFIKEKRSVSEVENILFQEGIDSETAQSIIDEISNRIKTLKMERARNSIIRGIVFIILGLIFYGIRANAIHNGEMDNYGGGVDYIGLIAILYGIHKIINGYHKKSCLKRDDFSRSLD